MLINSSSLYIFFCSGATPTSSSSSSIASFCSSCQISKLDGATPSKLDGAAAAAAAAAAAFAADDGGGCAGFLESLQGGSCCSCCFAANDGGGGCDGGVGILGWIDSASADDPAHNPGLGPILKTNPKDKILTTNPKYKS